MADDQTDLAQAAADYTFALAVFLAMAGADFDHMARVLKAFEEGATDTARTLAEDTPKERLN